MTVSALQLSCKSNLFLRLLRQNVPPRPVALFGLDFPNPIGLAAGLDKNAVALPAWDALGFGFIEVGAITAKPQPGNAKPRVFRYPALEAVINRFGFNNDGAEAVAMRLARLRKRGGWPRAPVGINLGKSKVTPLDEAPADYLFSFKTLFEYGDYFALNVSSPNTPGLRNLQGKEELRTLLETVQNENRARAKSKPLLLKIAPDLSDEQLLEIVALAVEYQLAGIIATNTTLDHGAIPPGCDQQGGLSGKPLRRRSTEVVRFLAQNTQLPLIGVGGIHDAASAREKFDAGAVLIQIYTGLIYQGPGMLPLLLP